MSHPHVVHCRGLLFFTVVVLIGTGWSYMKPFIDDNTKRILMVVVPLQVGLRPRLLLYVQTLPLVHVLQVCRVWYFSAVCCQNMWHACGCRMFNVQVG